MNKVGRTVRIDRWKLLFYIRNDNRDGIRDKMYNQISDITIGESNIVEMFDSNIMLDILEKYINDFGYDGFLLKRSEIHLTILDKDTDLEFEFKSGSNILLISAKNTVTCVGSPIEFYTYKQLLEYMIEIIHLYKRHRTLSTELCNQAERNVFGTKIPQDISEPVFGPS